MKKNTAIIVIIIITLFLVVFLASCKAQEERTIKNDNNDAATSVKTTSSPEGTDGNNLESETESKKDNIDSATIKIDEADPSEGEYFVYAILKSINEQNNTIEVEQIINEPNEKEIQPSVILADNCQIAKITLEMETEKETFSTISLSDIKLNSEIGIIFNSNNAARAIIFQEVKQ